MGKLKRVSIGQLEGHEGEHGWVYIDVVNPGDPDYDYSNFGDHPKDRDEDYYDPDDPSTWD